MLLKFSQLSFLFLKVTKIKKALDILLIGKIACILLFLSSQIGNISIISLLLLYLLFKFTVAGDLGFLGYKYVKFFIDTIIIATIPVLPKYTYK